MQLRRIVIALEEPQRVILYPEGGLEIENLVVGVGWVIDTSGTDYPELADLLQEAACIAGQQAQAHADYEEDIAWAQAQQSVPW